MADDLYKTLGRFIVAANGIHDAVDRYRAVVAKIREKNALRARTRQTPFLPSPNTTGQ